MVGRGQQGRQEEGVLGQTADRGECGAKTGGKIWEVSTEYELS